MNEQPTLTLTANHLAKSYNKRPVVKDVCLKVKQGQVVGLLGPNGAGKTTCFYMIAGLINQDRGQIYIGSDNVSHQSMHQRARLGLGYLPQEASIFRKLSVEQNILAILQTRNELTKAEQKQQLNELLHEFSIEHIRQSKGMALSGGERRRVEIARALAMEPKFILLDEPFAGVDPISVNEIKDIISHLRKRNIGVLITDHNVRETLDICEKAYIVGNGVIIAEGQPEAVLNNQLVKDTYLGQQFSL